MRPSEPISVDCDIATLDSISRLAYYGPMLSSTQMLPGTCATVSTRRSSVSESSTSGMSVGTIPLGFRKTSHRRIIHRLAFCQGIALSTPVLRYEFHTFTFFACRIGKGRCLRLCILPPRTANEIATSRSRKSALRFLRAPSSALFRSPFLGHVDTCLHPARYSSN